MIVIGGTVVLVNVLLISLLNWSCVHVLRLPNRNFNAFSTLCFALCRGVAMYGSGDRSCIETNGNVSPITGRNDVPIAASAK